MKKLFIFVVLALILLGAIRVHYLLQPSGDIADFSTWTQSAHLHSPHRPDILVKYFGVSTLLFDDGKDQILIDGFFSRPTLRQVALEKIQSDTALLDQMIQRYDLKRLKAILVTHSHYDHALDIAYLAKRTGAKIIGSNTTHWIAKGGQVPASQLHLSDPEHVYVLGNFHVRAIPSRHTPPTLVNNDLGETLTAPLVQPTHATHFVEGGSYDYYLQAYDHRILVKASTDFVPYAYQGLEVDSLFLGVAQLAKQSAAFQHAYLSETIGKLKPRLLVPIHWDNFFSPLSKPLQLFPRLADNSPKSLHLAIDAAQKQGADVVMMTTSGSLGLPLKHPANDSD